jgi:CxxC-x17-CxxC domain-containing protein
MNHNDGGERCVCSECGAEFHFTTAEQRFYEERGLNFPPKRCKACRMARKSAGPGGAPRGAREGGGGFRDGSGGYAPRDPGGFRGPAGYGGGQRGDDRRGPPARAFDDRAPRPSFQGNDGGFRPRVGGFAPRGPRAFDDRGPPRGRGGYDAPPPAAYGQDRPAPRGYSRDGRDGGRDFRDARPPAEPRKARVAREKPKFDITCQQCGAHASVPFKPLPGRDIFCPTCYRARKGLSPEERAATSIANRAPENGADRVTAPGGEPDETMTSPAAPAVEEGSPHEE